MRCAVSHVGGDASEQRVCVCGACGAGNALQIWRPELMAICRPDPAVRVDKALLKGDREVVLAGMAQIGNALQCASAELKRDC